MIFPEPKDEEEAKRYRRAYYENEKEDLILAHKQMGFPEDTLNQFIVNSLKGYEEFLKEDGLI